MFGKIINYQVKENQVIINFKDKVGIVNVLSDEVIWLHEEAMSSFKVESNSFTDKIEFSTNTVDGNVIIKTNKYIFIIEDNFKLRVVKDGQLISYERDIEFKNDTYVNYDLIELEGHSVDRSSKQHQIMINKVCNKMDYFYGFGEKTGFLNKRGYEYEMWNTDNPEPHVDSFRTLYKSIPYYITFNKDYCYGFFFDNTYKQFYDVAKTHEDCVSIGFDKGYFNYYFIGGDSIRGIVSNYALITGKTPLPQRWTLGHQQCRWSYLNEEELMFVAEKYRELNIPCDVLFLDIDYMERFKVFTYNQDTFKNFPQMVKKLNEMGFKLVTIIDPGVKVEKGYNIYEEAIKNGYVATKDGKTYINAVWPGDSVFPSFISSDVREWWGKNLKFLTDLGVSGIWNDMNEPASFKGPLPDDVEFKGDDKIYYHDEIHNVYGHYMAKATYNGLVKHTGKRPFIITRACYAGTQKYSTIWTGDNHSIWAHLEMAIPMFLNLGLSGYSFAGTDVGGFGSDCTKELLCRWSQLGAFTPLFRNHSAAGTRHQEPWTFDEETVNIYRKSVEIRYELIPYFYDLYYEGTKNGLPLWRPLVMNYENDFNTYELNDQFMLGDEMIVAPIVKQGARNRMVYLPKGKWYNYFTKEEYQAGYNIAKADLDTIPVYVKEGAIIPKSCIKQYITEEDELILDIYPGSGKYIHYQDNGLDFNYQNGEYNLYEIAHIDNKVKISLLHQGYKLYKKIILNYLDKKIEITNYEKEYLID